MKCFLDHIALCVHDEEAMVDFYMGVIGFEPERVDLFREGKALFPSVRINPDTIIDFFPEKLWRSSKGGEKGFQGMDHFCITLDQEEWALLKMRLEKRGIPLLEGPVQRWGAHGTGTSIYFHDPEKNMVEAKYYGE